MSKSIISSLAILKVNWDKLGRDYIENFVPFIVECARISPSDVISLPDLQGAINTNFGLLIPLNPLRQILLRAEKQGFLFINSGVFCRNVDRCAKTDFNEIQRKVVNTYTSVINHLVLFTKNNYSIEWTSEEAEIALVAFMCSYGLEMLYNTDSVIQIDVSKYPEGGSYIVAAFMSDCIHNNIHLFRDIEVLVKGYLLANALYLPEEGKVAQKFKDTRVYFDTSLIVYAAGFAGPQRAAPMTELIGILQDNGAELYCFQQTYDEVKGILDACAAKFRRGQLRDAYGPTIEYFLELGYSSSDIDLLGIQLASIIGTIGIKIDDKPPYEKEYLIDEQAFDDTLEKDIGYQNPKAKIHDVDCVSAIARLRRGRESYVVETSYALFVTSNTALAKTTRKFFQSTSSPGAIALAITDYSLGNLLWLKNPTKSPTLPVKRLIADSYAAMQPPETLWKNYLAEISRLEQKGSVTADDYYLLRHSLSAKAALMEITRGDVTAFSEGTVSEVLEVAKRNLRADLEKKLEIEKYKTITLENDIEEAKNREQKRHDKLNSFANSLSRMVAHSAFIIAMLILAIAVTYTFPWTLPTLDEGWPRYAMALAQVGLFIITIANIAWGTTVKSQIDKIEVSLTSIIMKKLVEFIQ